MHHLSCDAVRLHFFLTAVADGNGLSFYSGSTITVRLDMPLQSLFQARAKLLGYHLIAYEPLLIEVLSLLRLS